MPYPFENVQMKVEKFRHEGVVATYNPASGVAHFEFDKTTIGFHEANTHMTNRAVEDLMDPPVESPETYTHIQEMFSANAGAGEDNWQSLFKKAPFYIPKERSDATPFEATKQKEEGHSSSNYNSWPKRSASCINN